MVTSKRSVQIQANPRCTAVRGCTRPAFVLSFRLPSGKRCRICQMHRLRLARTKKLGPARGFFRAADPRDDARAREMLRKLVKARGREWSVLGVGPQTCRVRALDDGESLGTTCAPSTLHAMQRRGWIKLSPYKADGSRVVEVKEIPA